jgi:alpha-L-rhamnosidase
LPTQRKIWYTIKFVLEVNNVSGYGGDVVATAEMALLNLDMQLMYSKRIEDFADAIRPNDGLTECAPYNGLSSSGLGGDSGPIGIQLLVLELTYPGWDTVFPELQYLLYQYNGDSSMIEEQYETTKNWLNFLASTTSDYIISIGLSDWSSVATPSVALTSTAFFYLNAKRMAQFAEIMGKQDDFEKYSQLAAAIKVAFNKNFLNTTSGQYASGTQCAQAFSLYFDLLPNPSWQSQVLEVLVNDIIGENYHLDTGIFGTKYMLNVLRYIR